MVTKELPEAKEADLLLKETDRPHAGMPSLDDSANRTSFFEFWPFWAFYTPIILYIFWLVVRFRGPTLMCNSNPAIALSGFVGESKLAVLDRISGPARHWVSPYTSVICKMDKAETHMAALAAMDAAALSFPLVAKPDLGMRGVGVQLLNSCDDLKRYIADFPDDARFILQKLVDVEGEVGAYYVRMPGAEKGTVTGLTLKYFQRVTGDGVRTLGQLIKDHPRAGSVIRLYQKRFADRWDDIPPEGQSIRLAFSGSHSKGCLFRDGTELITDALSDRVDEIAKAMDGFYVGRLDLRFGDFDTFLEGRGFRIIEVNGAGGENTQIWDSRTTLRQAWSTLFQQYRILWAIGAANRRRGVKPPSVWYLYHAWRREVELTGHYPHTH